MDKASGFVMVKQQQALHGKLMHAIFAGKAHRASA